MLNDGHATYTPGLSENRGGVSTYAASDVLGNLWFMDNGSGQQTYYQDTTAFGSGQNMGLGGTEASPFKFGGANGCQTDADTGLVLMGHRYYDTRIGRFITQDPAGDGDNWYAYADNDPVDEVDPEGLAPQDGPGSSPVGSPGYADGAATGSAGAMDEYGMNWQRHTYISGQYQTPGVTHLTLSYYWTSNTGAGMSPFTESYQRPGESNTHYFFRGLWWAIKQVATAQPDPGYTVDRSRWGTGKAPWQVEPGTRSMKGEYIDKTTGRVEPWEAHYDQYGRQIGRTDYNAGNKTDGIPDTHYHTYNYSNTMRNPTASHVPGEFNP